MNFTLANELEYEAIQCILVGNDSRGAKQQLNFYWGAYRYEIDDIQCYKSASSIFQ